MLMVLGVWVMLLFSLGFPSELKVVLAVITGLLIVIIAYRLKSDQSGTASTTNADLPYADHHNE